MGGIGKRSESGRKGRSGFFFPIGAPGWHRDAALSLHLHRSGLIVPVSSRQCSLDSDNTISPDCPVKPRDGDGFLLGSASGGHATLWFSSLCPDLYKQCLHSASSFELPEWNSVAC